MSTGSNERNLGRFILPEYVEDEAVITKLRLYKAPTWKVVLYWILCLCTGGIFFLLARWRIGFKRFIRCLQANEGDANVLIIEGQDGSEEYIEIYPKELYLTGESKIYRCFRYRLYTYYFDEKDQVFRPVQFSVTRKKHSEILQTMSNGLHSREILDQRFITYGKNSTTVPEKNWLQIIVDEVLSPFYIFQLFSCILWGGFEEYVIYACVIAGISIFSILLSLYSIKMNYRRLRRQANYNIPVKVFRFHNEGIISYKNHEVVDSSQLVPGDIIEIPQNALMPCDLILLNGVCIMNESMLTGESIPVIKQAMAAIDKEFDPIHDQKHIAFSGTKCLETRRTGRGAVPVVGVVIQTGYSTMKGKLVRSLIYPKPELFRFYQDALTFIGFMFGIAMILFVYTVIIKIKHEAETDEIIIKACDIVTITVPPALATCNTIAQELSTQRLEKAKIMTKSKTKINVAGRIDVMCFDKTGTLTEDSLDFYGIRAVEQSSTSQFSRLCRMNVHKILNNTGETKTTGHQLLELMASCHSLTYIQKEISGDPLEVRMFHTINWNLIEGDVHSNSNVYVTPPSSSNTGYFNPSFKTKIIKRFEFVPKLQRMSTIVQDSGETSQRIYVKGSPEKVKELCSANSIPKDFEETLSLYTQSGLRVIACATKSLQQPVTEEDDLDREKYESGLDFIGFIIFQNKLKPETVPGIKKLKYAEIPTVMITGDNALTAVCVARDCAIIDSHQSVILAELKVDETNAANKEITFKQISILKSNEDDRTRLETSTMEDLNNELIPTVSIQEIANSPDKILPLVQDPNAILATTGDALKFLTHNIEYRAIYDNIITRSRVYARMRPEEKAYVVEEIQKQGYLVGMVGDGANDCPALKTANIGISLSDAEASLAAPFSSKVFDISCVDILLREGRCLLVTTFQIFKFMAVYSMIQGISVGVLYVTDTFLSNNQFLCEDLFIVLPLTISMSYTKPHDVLAPEKPISRLISTPVLVSVVGQILIILWTQIVLFDAVLKQDWYVDLLVVNENVDDYDESATFTCCALFLFSIFQYIGNVIAFSVGKPFRKEFWTNWSFCLFLAWVIAECVALLWTENEDILLLMSHVPLPNDFKGLIQGFAIGNIALILIYEWLVSPRITKFIEGLKCCQRKASSKKITH